MKTQTATTQRRKAQDLAISILVDQEPKEVFDAVNNVRGWWSEEIEGDTGRRNGEFTYRYRDAHYCQIKLVEFVPGKKVVWLVKYNYFNFTKDRSEWTGTKIIFDISKKGSKTQLVFTHKGLVPQYECYDVCSNAWGRYIQESLFQLITTGKGYPNRREKPLKTKSK